MFARFSRIAFHKFAVVMIVFCLVGISAAQHYTRTDLTADVAATSPTAPNLDPNLVNAWGLARSSSSPWWVADNGTGLASLYNATGVPQALVVKIPTADGTGTSVPTGTVWNYSTGFEVAPGRPAVFLFCTEDGTIAAWNPNVDRNNAILKVLRGGKAIYKGCALAQTDAGVFLYATNFESKRVEVFDSNFQLVASKEPDFKDHGRAQNYAPFGIQNVGGNLVVTFAKRESGSNDEEHGPGLGFVAIFDPTGQLLLRLEHGDFLNAPWGVALAPGDFGRFSHRLLIGNFGDGTIHAFNVVSGKHEGMMLTSAGAPLAVDGLWSISFGANSANSGLATELYYTAGPNDEQNGLFGKITAVASENRGTSE
ncbi:MAG TPA: TIGR03118 family protein [Terriglobales bacterium]|nr:TIGR03118 family protein [Terriglobales bacterium]